MISATVTNAITFRSGFVRDLTGTIKAWIEVGAPDAARIHKASKAAPRVAVIIR